MVSRFQLQPTIYAPSQSSFLRSEMAGRGELRGRDSRERATQGRSQTGERFQVSQSSHRSPEPVGAGS